LTGLKRQGGGNQENRSREDNPMFAGHEGCVSVNNLAYTRGSVRDGNREGMVIFHARSIALL
jgi:hypothetical protein